MKVVIHRVSVTLRDRLSRWVLENGVAPGFGIPVSDPIPVQIAVAEWWATIRPEHLLGEPHAGWELVRYDMENGCCVCVAPRRNEFLQAGTGKRVDELAARMRIVRGSGTGREATFRALHPTLYAMLQPQVRTLLLHSSGEDWVAV